MGVLLLLALAWGIVHLPVWRGAARLVATGWADDLLVLPLVLGIALQVQRRLAGRCDGYVLPVVHVMAAVTLFAALFEGLLPRLSTRYTADPVDCALYLLGGLLFQAALNRPVASRCQERLSPALGRTSRKASP